MSQSQTSKGATVPQEPGSEGSAREYSARERKGMDHVFISCKHEHWRPTGHLATRETRGAAPETRAVDNGRKVKNAALPADLYNSASWRSARKKGELSER